MTSRAAKVGPLTTAASRRGITHCTTISHAAIARSHTQCSDAAWEHLSTVSPCAIVQSLPPGGPRTGSTIQSPNRISTPHRFTATDQFCQGHAVRVFRITTALAINFKGQPGPTRCYTPRRATPRTPHERNLNACAA